MPASEPSAGNPSTPGFKARAARALAWNLSFNFLRDLGQFGVTLILVRLLDPAAYGMAALVNGAIAFLAVFSLSGFLAHSLQLAEGREVDFQSHFSAGGVLQGGLFVLAQLLALGLWWLPDYRPLAPLAHFYALRLLLDWPSELRRAMLRRDLNWSRLVTLDAVGLILASCLGLGMAWGGAGVYALLAPGLVTPLLLALDLFALARWRPAFTFDRPGYSAALSFGLRRIGSLAAERGRGLLETAILAQVAGFAAAGVFGRALALGGLFCQRFASQAMAAIYPALARIEATDPRYSRLSAVLLQGVFWLALPVGVLFARLADPLVRVVYGEQWLGVVALLPAAAGWSVLAALTHTAYLLILGADGQGACLKTDLLRLGLALPALFWVLPVGVAPYLWTLGGVELVVLAYLGFQLSGRGLLDAGALIASLLPAALCAGLALAACEVISLATQTQPRGFTHSLLYGLVFVLLYGASLWGLFPQAVRTLLEARQGVGRS